MAKYEEITISGITFRIRIKRSLLQQGKIEKIYTKEGGIGIHDLIKNDCEIFDRETKLWREIKDDDLKDIDYEESKPLVDKLMDMRNPKKEDFQNLQEN